MALTTGPISGAIPSTSGGSLTYGGKTPGSVTPTPTVTQTQNPVDALSGDQRNAYEYVKGILDAAGLGTLAPLVLGYVQQSYNQDTISLLIQDAPEWKTRFAGNEDRKKAGLPVLSPGEYLATEQSYRSAMLMAGLPSGFYDSPDDFRKWIGGGVSATEVQNRIDLARQEMYDKGPEWRQAMRDYYPELGDGDLVAATLDQTKALPLLEQQWRRADIGSAASRAGLALGLDRASQLDNAGVSGAQAQQGFQSVAGLTNTFDRLGQVYGVDYAQNDAENEVFGLSGSTDAALKRKRLASQERASFGGSGGVSDKSLGSKPA